MPKATSAGGGLVPLDKCYIRIPGFRSRATNGGDKITFDILPDITDSKNASYNDATVIGRSNPIKTYSHSDNRVISMQMHFVITDHCDIQDNLAIMRALQSCVYPREGVSDSPYRPPPVCQIRCGELLAKGDAELCVVLTSVQTKFQTDVAWDDETFCPYALDIDTTWHVVYTPTNLPGQERILEKGI